MSKKLVISKAIGWMFVDKNGENYFDNVFVDKFSAEMYGKLKNCKGKAIPIKLKDLLKIKEGVLK